MHVNPETLLLDNPLLTKHLRARLRPGHVLPTGVIVVVLCILLAWMGYLNNGFVDGTIFRWTTTLQGVILVIMGASQVAGSVGGVRESSILDFHRISPVPAVVITTGFFLGAPVREYVLYSLTLPLSAFCASQGYPGGTSWLQVQAALLLIALNFHALALLSSLIAKKPKTNSWGIVIFLAVVFFYSGSTVFALSRGFMGQPVFRFYGVEVPWFPFLCLYLVPSLVFLLIASTRKMRSERAHALSKPQALVFVSAVGFLFTGGMTSLDEASMPTTTVLYGLVLTSLPSMISISPLAGDYARGLRRAARSGRTHLPPWDDLALSRLAIFLICLIVLSFATLASDILVPFPFGAINYERGLNRSIPIAVLVVAYFGLAYQYFALRIPRRAGTMMALFLFFAWVVPLLAGGVAGLSDMSEWTIVALVSISPVAGLATASGLGPSDDVLQIAQIAALLPAIALAFLFNNLVTSARRRVESETVEAGDMLRKKRKPADPFAEEDAVVGDTVAG